MRKLVARVFDYSLDLLSRTAFSSGLQLDYRRRR